MPILPIVTAGVQYVIRLHGDNTTGVLAVIHPQGTADRPNPPQPHNGFHTALTPFGNGHVFALSLGGTDERRNLVPQWEQWQQTGAWRRVETECLQFVGKIFRCDIVYDPAAANTYDQTKLAFSTKRLIRWSDPRLPTGFRVRVYDHPVAAVAAVGSDAAYDALVGMLDKKKPLYDSQHMVHDAMPPEDVVYWQGQVKAGLAQAMYDQFVSDERARVESTGSVFDSTIDFTGFVLHPETHAALKGALANVPGFSQTDINGLQIESVFMATHAGGGKGYAKRQSEFKKTFGTGDGAKKRRDATVVRAKNEREKRVESYRKGS